MIGIDVKKDVFVTYETVSNGAMELSEWAENYGDPIYLGKGELVYHSAKEEAEKKRKFMILWEQYLLELFLSKSLKWMISASIACLIIAELA